MEIFRQNIADSFVLKVLNRKKFMTNDFVITNDSCMLAKEAYKKWCQCFEEYVNKPVKKFNDKSPREYIVSETRILAAMIFANAETQNIQKMA